MKLKTSIFLSVLTESASALPALLLAVLTAASVLPALASVDIRWTVETSRVDPQVFEAYQGETIDFSATLQSYGKPVSIPPEETFSFYFQTNGMGSAWWHTNATVRSEILNLRSEIITNAVLSATFSPSLDTGARVYNCFIGSPGSLYRAAFQLRLKPSPGALPNVITEPPQILDLAHTVVVNPPWPTDQTIDTRIRQVIHEDGITAEVNPEEIRTIVTGKVDKAYVESLGVSVKTDDVAEIVNQAISTNATLSTLTSQVSSLESSKASVNQTIIIEDNMAGTKTVTEPFLSFEGMDVESLSVFGTFVTTAGLKIDDKYLDVPGWNSIRYYKNFSYHTLQDSLDNIDSNASDALTYSSGIYRYMLGQTNAWFEGTNYNTNAEQAAGKVKYQPEEWENVLFTPPSLQLFEIRDGERKCVWDQRDWTVYYWNFKSAQLSNNLERVISSIETNYMRRGWSKYTAVNGLDNPATDTTFIDTPKISLMAGHNWEKMIEVGGTGYYTITGNGIELGPQDAESTFLNIKDFEGNACLTFRKTSSYLVYCETGSDIVSSFSDGQGRVVFHLTTAQQPTAEFSTILDSASFVEQTDENSPADYEWTGSSGSWDCHMKLKTGIESPTLFARFKIQHEGENVVEHSIPIKLSGGIVFEQGGITYKIKPSISGGNVVWSVVQ